MQKMQENNPGTNSIDRKQRNIADIIKTAVPLFTGALFGAALYATLGTAEGKTWYLVILLIVLVSYYILRFFYPIIKINVSEFEAKDWLYAEFMILFSCLMVWTLLLNPGN